MPPLRRARAILFTFLLATTTALGEPAARREADLTLLSVEDLLRVQTISASKHPEQLQSVPAALHVITAEDIRRSGAASIAEALRLVPGMNVARVNADSYAITARGLNSLFSRFLLVLVDGREVYTPMFAGVFWDVQDTLLEDVDRIEVIRGPGATLWGANAVNGVINLITKPARDTQGLLVTAGGGTEERAFGAARFGGRLGEDVFLRLFAKGWQRDDGFAAAREANDNGWQTRGGARLDWTPTPANRLTAQGELYVGDAGDTFSVADPVTFAPLVFADRVRVDGGHLLGRWRHLCQDDAEITWQAYYDHTQRSWETITECRDTFDVEFQHRFRWGHRQDFTWGGNYRVSADRTRGSAWADFDPANRTLHWAGVFVQDDLTLVPRYLHFIVGTKLEHNDYTGWEIQPSARLQWTPTPRQTVWAVVSRAVRTPSRADTDIRFWQEHIGLVPEINGNPAFVSETLVAIELGHRAQLAPQLSSDFALFYNSYGDIRSAEIVGIAPPFINVQEQNNLFGHTYGGEFVVRWQPLTWCRLEGQYSFVKTEFRAAAGSNDSQREQNSPQHQGALRVALDLPRGWEFDCGARAVESLASQDIPGYVTLDARVAWRPSTRFEFAVVGQNLLDDHHPEFPSLFTIQATEVERGVYGKATWRY